MRKLNGKNHTIELLEDTINSTRATATGHGNVKFVGVFTHIDDLGELLSIAFCLYEGRGSDINMFNCAAKLKYIDEIAE
jgi:hypothetical protein